MAGVKYFQQAVKNMHKECIESVKGLTTEQLHFMPLGQGNHIAFLAWHVVRTEDLVFNFLLQKKTPVWNAEGWDKKFGLDPRAQGTGMSREQVAGLKINDIEEFSRYMRSAFDSTEAFIDSLKDEDLDQVHELPALGKRSMSDLVGGMILQHGVGHIAEIAYIKGLQGMAGSH